MEERSPRTVSRLSARRAAGPALVAAVALAVAGCHGLHAGPRTLASVGAFSVAAGSGLWGSGEVVDATAHPSTSHALVGAGFASVVVGLAAIVVAGGWMAASVACKGDPDCADEEQCREIPAPPGGIPYRQCIPR
jgi:hypothetical protein